jgi:hypothetical protein
MFAPAEVMDLERAREFVGRILEPLALDTDQEELEGRESEWPLGVA